MTMGITILTPIVTMEDFSYQYHTKADNIEDLNVDLDAKLKTGKVENNFLRAVNRALYTMSGIEFHLDFLDNHAPYKGAFFAQKVGGNIQIPLGTLAQVTK